MNGAVNSEVAAQARARREATAKLGKWEKLLIDLSALLRHDSGSGTVQEALEYLQKEKTRSDALAILDKIKEEAAQACDLKDSEALQWKEQGNKAYNAKKLEESILMYTRGMMCASNDEMLSILINNRSTAFFAQNRILEALADAHNAFVLRPTYWKALQRRSLCLEKLGLLQESERDREAANNAQVDSANPAEVIQRILRVSLGNGEDYRSTAAQNGLEISSTMPGARFVSGMKGVVATGPLEAGTVLTEAPSAYALYDDHWAARCCYCLRVTRTLYPSLAYRSRGKACRGLFCSEACADLSWERDGKYETANPFFQLCPIDTLVASRLLRSEQGAQIEAKWPRSDFTGELYPASVVGGYETVVSLVALALGAVDASGADRLRQAQRQVISHGFELKFFTGTQVVIDTETRGATVDESRPIFVGKAVYSTLAHFRHSCDPNCFASFVGNPLGCSLTMCVRAIRSISPEEELTIAYFNMTRYKAVSAYTRRRALVERCGFLCNCQSCLNDKDELVSGEKKAFYIQAGDLYQKGLRLLREGQFDVAVTVLSQSYALTMEHLCPPPRPPQAMVPKVHMALAKAFNRLGDNQKCVEHLLGKVELDRQLYGANHVEFVDDFVRLAFFEVTCERRRMFAQQAVELLRRFYAPSKDLETQISRLESFVEQRITQQDG
uniref:SET domain-containing protein n=1 Tax=Trypanosoma vivax (strain Y486) TaxID=1055687 RepID=G0TUL0_TRYVY|nr:conserved hypothetical protein [Trypanosoma vivax Y486]